MSYAQTIMGIYEAAIDAVTKGAPAEQVADWAVEQYKPLLDERTKSTSKEVKGAAVAPSEKEDAQKAQDKKQQRRRLPWSSQNKG